LLFDRLLCFLWPLLWLPAYKPPRPAADPAYDEPWCELWCELLPCFLCFLCFLSLEDAVSMRILQEVLSGNLLVVLVVLVRQHVRPNGASYKTADRSECSSTELVPQESTAGAAYERRPEAAIAFCRPSRCARLSILPLRMALLRCVALLGRGTVLLLLLRVGGMAAVRVVALVVVTIAALVLLWGLVWRVRRGAIGTLRVV